MRRHRFVPRFDVLESRDLLRGPADAPLLGAPPPPSANVIWVDTVAELQNAVQNLQSNQTIVIQKGTYQLNRTLYIGKDQPVSNVTIRGETDNFNDVVIKGLGMDGPFVNSLALGISVYNAQDVTIANLSVGDVYWHAIDLQASAGAERVKMYHCRFFDAGEQIIKSNSGGGGADDCVLEYCLVEYTNGPSVLDHGGGTGYTAALHAHETDRWQIRHNLFRNFHSPDTVYHWFSPVVLMWNGSADTVVEGNTFVDCDRAVALGLVDKAGGYDHQGGVVRNNFVYQRPGLFSAARRAASDGQLLVYDSPGTQVYHNTVLTNNNSRFSIEVRWANTGVAFNNNLTDAPLGSRDGGTYSAAGNYLGATASMFVNPSAGDLHLLDNAQTRASVIDRAAAQAGATADFDLSARPQGAAADVGADEIAGQSDTIGPRILQAVPSGTSSVSYVELTFSEAIDPASFTLADVTSFFSPNNTALTATGVAAVAGSNNTRFRVSFAAQTAPGSYRLDLGPNIADAAGNPMDQNNNGTKGEASDFYRATFTIAASNSPPVLQPVADQTVASTQQTVSVALSASDANNDPISYTATAQSLAYVFKQQYGLYTNGNFYINVYGKQDKWVRGSGTGWYFLLPTGNLYQWDGVTDDAVGTLLGNVGLSYYDDPYRLVNAAANDSHVNLPVNGNTLTITRDPSWVSAAVLSVTASDGKGGSDSETFTLVVTAGQPALPMVSIAATDASAGEPANPGTFTISRTGSTATALTVNFSVTGTATNGSDYTAIPTSVTIPAGAASVTITVSPTDDTLVEPGETVVLTLSPGAAYQVGSANAATVSIADNDSASNSPPVLQPITNRTVPSSQQAVSVALSASDANNDPISYTASAQSLAYVFKQQYALYTDGNLYSNYYGKQEKWVKGNGTGWYFLLPNGNLYQWDGVTDDAVGTLLGNVGSSYHQDPYRLVNASANNAHVTLAVSGNTLTITRDLSWVSAIVVTVTASDGKGGSDTESFTVTVTT